MAVAVWVAAARWGQAIGVATMEAAVGVAGGGGNGNGGVAMHTKYNEVPKRILGRDDSVTTKKYRCTGAQRSRERRAQRPLP